MRAKSDHQLPPAQYIDSAAGLARLRAAIANEPLLAVDTESNSLHAYRERVCLIQLSTRQADYIIDPLRCPSLDSLADIFASPQIELVFHAAEYDIMTLKRDFGFQFANLFDTMTAARVLGVRNAGLSRLLLEHFGVRSNKSHQKSNWARRPLSPASLQYAQQDTHYLPALRDIYHASLVKNGRMEEARELFAAQAVTPAASHRFDENGYWPIAKSARLTPEQTAILRECFLLREEIAREKDRPPFQIMGKDTLAKLARQAPARKADLREFPGLSAFMRRGNQERLLQAIARGRMAEAPRPPRRPRLKKETRNLLNRLLDWRKWRASQRDVEADIIISRAALRAIAIEQPLTKRELARLPGIGPWRLAEYGAELLELVARRGD